MQATKAVNQTDRTELIINHPKFKELVTKRNKLSIILTILMLIFYFGFIGLIAFNKEFLATQIGDSIVTLGLPVGFGLIIISVLLTWYFVVNANGPFDKMRDELLAAIENVEGDKK
ncbi:DUF485 domain-containing protein [Thorsellia kenyensis]|uniref:DUF485 domain-containing protein n=1 Tax=Thorsellia kenyensis TaxID=1549888 RepID=A0ABV6CC82_9GAMM